MKDNLEIIGLLLAIAIAWLGGIITIVSLYALILGGTVGGAYMIFNWLVS